ncbi:MAG: dihydrodipicolinate synthase family protein [Pirellulales bacterium]|nr:dihydrodipicolinate synthase family protein [Pirellulales bacterium]
MRQDHHLELIPATFSPMDPGGSVDGTPIEAYAEYLLNHGMATVFINGTTGESLSLTLDERRILAERWIQAASGSIKVMVHVGHNCIADSMALARHAEETGVAAISSMAPNFFRPGCVEDLIAFLSPIAAAAPQTPFYYYHIPSLTGVELALDAFLEMASDRIPTFAGVKYTHYDLTEYLDCQDKWGGRYQLLFGRDEFLLSALSVGALGAIGTTFNIFPKTFAKIAKAFFEKDIVTARKLSINVNQGISLFKKYGLLRYGKKFMATVGVDCGEVRRPLKPATQDRFDELMAALRELPLPDNMC